MKSGIHLQKSLRQVITKDGAIVTYKLVHFPKPNAIGNEKNSPQASSNTAPKKSDKS